MSKVKQFRDVEQLRLPARSESAPLTGEWMIMTHTGRYGCGELAFLWRTSGVNEAKYRWLGKTRTCYTCGGHVASFRHTPFEYQALRALARRTRWRTENQADQGEQHGSNEQREDGGGEP